MHEGGRTAALVGVRGTPRGAGVDAESGGEERLRRVDRRLVSVCDDGAARSLTHHVSVISAAKSTTSASGAAGRGS